MTGVVPTTTEKKLPTLTEEELQERVVKLTVQVESLRVCVVALLELQGLSTRAELRGLHNLMKRLEEESSKISEAHEALVDSFL